MLLTPKIVGTKTNERIASGYPTSNLDRAIEKTLVLPVCLPSISVEDFSEAAKGAFSEMIRLVFLAKMIELPLLEGEMIVLGRAHITNKMQPTIDLSQFGGKSSGTSRMHVAIRRENGEWLLEDLGSSNGTWVNGERLAPFVVHRLNSTSHLMLANLEVGLIVPYIHDSKAPLEIAHLDIQSQMMVDRLLDKSFGKTMPLL